MIRKAEKSDMKDIMGMSREMWALSCVDCEFEEEHATEIILFSIGQNLAFVFDDNGVNGFISAVKCPSLGSSKYIIASEISWWIKLGYRGKMAGVRLIRALESECIKQGVSQLNMIHMESYMPERVKGIYHALGYNLQETTHTKVFCHGAS